MPLARTQLCDLPGTGNPPAMYLRKRGEIQVWVNTSVCCIRFLHLPSLCLDHSSRLMPHLLIIQL